MGGCVDGMWGGCVDGMWAAVLMGCGAVSDFMMMVLLAVVMI